MNGTDVLQQTSHSDAGGWVIASSEGQSQDAGEVSQTVL